MASDIKYMGMDVHHTPKRPCVFVKRCCNGVFMVYSVDKKLEKTFVSDFTLAEIVDNDVKGSKADKFKVFVKGLFANVKIRVTDICITPDVREALC